MQPVTIEFKPNLNAIVDHPEGYGIYKDMRKIKGMVCCILIDPHTPGYADPTVQGDRYAVPIKQCQWAGDDANLSPTVAASPPTQCAVTHAWITPGKPDWWQELEHRLIEATTFDQLQQAKAKTSASRRSQVMNVWDTDGRYDWMKAKAARLQAEAEGQTQGAIGEVTA